MWFVIGLAKALAAFFAFLSLRGIPWRRLWNSTWTLGAVIASRASGLRLFSIGAPWWESEKGCRQMTKQELNALMRSSGYWYGATASPRDPLGALNSLAVQRPPASAYAEGVLAGFVALLCGVDLQRPESLNF